MEQLLRDGLNSLGLPTEGVPSLLRYADLLVEKNKVMNLTAITEPADIATLHFLDSAALLTLADFRNKTVADVGTGAGFPGMPLRILEDDFDLTLVKEGGYFLSMKAVDSDAELASAAHAIDILGGKVERTEDYDIPGTDVRHRLIFLKKVRETPKKYPRPFAKIKKNPL